MQRFCDNYEQLDSLYIYGYDPFLNNIEAEFGIKAMTIDYRLLTILTLDYRLMTLD